MQTQIRQLQDFRDYFEQEFAEGADSHSSQLMLFSMLNTIKDSNKKYTDLGEAISDREGDKVTRKSRKNYFWEPETNELQSPAKILKSGLTMTGRLF